MYMQVAEEAREGARSPGVEVTGDHETPDMDDGKKKLKISRRTDTLSVPRQDAVFDDTNFEIVCVR